MSTNNTNQTKFMLGIIALAGFTALAPAVNATTLESNLSLQDVLKQANLNLDFQAQQSEDTDPPSSEKRNPFTDNMPAGNGICGSPK